jgi:hypothetical protein
MSGTRVELDDRLPTGNAPLRAAHQDGLVKQRILSPTKEESGGQRANGGGGN